MRQIVTKLKQYDDTPNKSAKSMKLSKLEIKNQAERQRLKAKMEESLKKSEI